MKNIKKKKKKIFLWAGPLMPLTAIIPASLFFAFYNKDNVNSNKSVNLLLNKKENTINKAKSNVNNDNLTKNEDKLNKTNTLNKDKNKDKTNGIEAYKVENINEIKDNEILIDEELNNLKNIEQINKIENIINNLKQKITLDDLEQLKEKLKNLISLELNEHEINKINNKIEKTQLNINEDILDKVLTITEKIEEINKNIIDENIKTIFNDISSKIKEIENFSIYELLLKIENLNEIDQEELKNIKQKYKIEKEILDRKTEFNNFKEYLKNNEEKLDQLITKYKEISEKKEQISEYELFNSLLKELNNFNFSFNNQNIDIEDSVNKLNNFNNNLKNAINDKEELTELSSLIVKKITQSIDEISEIYNAEEILPNFKNEIEDIYYNLKTDSFEIKNTKPNSLKYEILEFDKDNDNQYVFKIKISNKKALSKINKIYKKQFNNFVTKQLVEEKLTEKLNNISINIKNNDEIKDKPFITDYKTSNFNELFNIENNNFSSIKINEKEYNINNLKISFKLLENGLSEDETKKIRKAKARITLSSEHEINLEVEKEITWNYKTNEDYLNQVLNQENQIIEKINKFIEQKEFLAFQIKDIYSSSQLDLFDKTINVEKEELLNFNDLLGEAKIKFTLKRGNKTKTFEYQIKTPYVPKFELNNYDNVDKLKKEWSAKATSEYYKNYFVYSEIYSADEVLKPLGNKNYWLAKNDDPNPNIIIYRKDEKPKFIYQFEFIFWYSSDYYKDGAFEIHYQDKKDGNWIKLNSIPKAQDYSNNSYKKVVVDIKKDIYAVKLVWPNRNITYPSLYNFMPSVKSKK
ncbi:hypothetical protein [[Mycoplasma] collis]|uniref:hypothetical protein n=1 Tax=[Mycoplasma] collis TaxID=2127 RepID=UPI00051BD0D2|nr:hypothetical protein [[Mycoplasma] collis]